MLLSIKKNLFENFFAYIFLHQVISGVIITLVANKPYPIQLLSIQEIISKFTYLLISTLFKFWKIRYSFIRIRVKIEASTDWCVFPPHTTSEWLKARVLSPAGLLSLANFLHRSSQNLYQEYSSDFVCLDFLNSLLVPLLVSLETL